MFDCTIKVDDGAGNVLFTFTTSMPDIPRVGEELHLYLPGRVQTNYIKADVTKISHCLVAKKTKGGKATCVHNVTATQTAEVDFYSDYNV
jgi:hypothetical protein